MEGHIIPNRVHVSVSIPPQYCVSKFRGYDSARMILDRHTNMKCKFGNRNFWVIGYYVSIVGTDAATLQKYIREQGKQDQIEDGLSRKEYADPLKDSK